MRPGPAAAAALAAGLLLAGCGDDLGGDFGTYTDCREAGRGEARVDAARDVDGAPAGGDLVGARLARDAQRLCVTFTTRERAASGSAFVVELRPREDAGGPLVALQAALFAGEEPGVVLRSTDAGEAGRIVEDATVGTRGEALSLAVPLAAITGATDRGVVADPAWTVRVISTDGTRRWTDVAPDRPPG